MGGLQLSDVVSESAVRFAIFFGSIALPGVTRVHHMPVKPGLREVGRARELSFVRLVLNWWGL
jgi:hypothetical protein